MDFRIDAASSAPFETFSLAWRFTEERFALLDASTLARLRPLTREAAASIAAQAVQRCAESAEPSLTFRSDEPPATVRRALVDLPVDGATLIVLSWDAATALVTDWACFVSHWDDFCYPASDDVTVWPLSSDWTLCYRRYEVFQYRRSSRAAAPATARRTT